MKLRKLKLLTTLSILSVATATCNAQKVETFTAKTLSQDSSKLTPVNGFTQIVVDTVQEQKYPLETVITIELPPNIINVGQSLNYILQNSGYHLKELSRTDPETLNLYTMEPPLSHRQFYRATVAQIVQTLAGEAFTVTVNHVEREIEITPFS